ncbi:MAG: SulP family inorganic anion transporter [Microscillaceae bacterium]|nr:SulP family inorganic anion transporter [Microscillaceae bacterium]
MSKFVVHKENYLASIKYDLPAGLVVFLVAIPLCLGIALASGAPFFSGIIAGIIGGLVVPLISQSQLSVSGPAAGLTAIVFSGILKIGVFEGFLVAVFIGGLIQIGLGFFKAGFVAYYIPSSVIKGMLAAIGIILILKELPHAVGYDHEIFSLAFHDSGHEDTFTALIHAFGHTFGRIEWEALIVSSICLAILIIWGNTPLKKIRWVPAALVVVIVGVLVNLSFINWFPGLILQGEHLVTLPKVNTLGDFLAGFTFPDWSYIFNKDVWIIAFTLGFVASVESLLTLEAVDKLDPFKRRSPLDRELIAQGVGNSLAGLVGGIPLTSVIVRSSANIDSGGRTKLAAIFHGLFLLLSVIFISRFLNMIPLASLAAILLMVGYKLARPSLVVAMYRQGWDQFIPFAVTIVAILLSDLLIGVAIGILVGLFFVIRSNFHSAVLSIRDGDHYLIKLNKDVSFLNKPLLLDALESIEENAYVIIDGSKAQFIDYDIQEVLDEFKEEAKIKSIQVEFRNIYRYNKEFIEDLKNLPLINT